MAAPIMFVRDSSDVDSHIATGWADQAFCGSKPYLKDIGWVHGADNTVFSGVTVCEDCRTAYGSLMQNLAARR
jgi:hypothetical protein